LAPASVPALNIVASHSSGLCLSWAKKKSGYPSYESKVEGCDATKA